MKKGISLVALVITIIVLIILTAAVILTATNTNIFGKSEEAVFKSDVKGFQEELTKSILEEQLKDNTFNPNTITTEGANADPITKWIPSIAGTKYEGMFKIDGGKLVYKGEDIKQIEYVQSIGISANPSTSASGGDNTSDTASSSNQETNPWLTRDNGLTSNYVIFDSSYDCTGDSDGLDEFTVYSNGDFYMGELIPNEYVQDYVDNHMAKVGEDYILLDNRLLYLYSF